MTTATISESERLNRLRLIRTRNVGAISWHRLLDRFGLATAALDALPELLRRGGGDPAPICSVADASRELDRAASLGLQAVCHGDAVYPDRLAAIEDAPPFLYVGGDTALLSRPAVAIVGARNASTNGRAIARELAQDLARVTLAGTPLAIVSGLARGIDTAAHDGALAADGATVAVMAGGADIVYPRENSALYERIAATGTVVSEMPPGLEPQARHFPRRNRIVSGLALGVVVVEAAARSGSLITARMALEQGRDVFAVPGSPRDPRCRGTNGLLRAGAILTENADDVAGALAPMLRTLPIVARSPEKHAEIPEARDDSVSEATRRAILDCMSPTPVAVDEIVRQCQVTASVVQMVLLELELAGRLERQPGNRVAALQTAS